MVDSLLPKTKTGKGLTYGSLLLAILGYLVELRTTVAKIETKIEHIETRFRLIDEVETLKKALNKNGE